MNIIVDRFFESNGYIENLKENLEGYGFNVFVCEYIPYIDEKLKIPDSFKEGLTFVYGTISFVKRVTEKYNNVVAFYSERDFDVSNYISLAPNHLFLNGDGFFVPFGLFVEKINYYFELFGESKLFIRPDSGNKLFTGFIVNKDNFEYEKDFIRKHSGTMERSMLYVSKVKSIKREYRTILSNNKVLSASLYFENNELTLSEKVPEGVLQKAQEFANLRREQKPDSYLVCDIAELDSGEFKIIELNAVSTSDLYFCDPKVLWQIALDYKEEIK